jgi:hypothetical protein
MKTTGLKRIGIASIVAVLFSVLLSSFNSAPGGDSFTIYLNDKLLVKQHVSMNEKVKTISMTQASSKDLVLIHYSHCGKMGIARNLMIRDQQNKTIKAWKFENSSDGDKGAMTVQATDLVNLQKSNVGNKLSLVYSSDQLPEGKVLALITSDGEVQASIK